MKVKTHPSQEWTASQLERKSQVEVGGSVLANKHFDHALIAWADSHGLLVRIDRRSPWGNPFRIGPDGNRQEVIAKYEEYFNQQGSLDERFEELSGKVLACWCYPEPCHGDVLLMKLL
jgi:Domain of unknown function (DUF4326)